MYKFSLEEDYNFAAAVDGQIVLALCGQMFLVTHDWCGDMGASWPKFWAVGKMFFL